jgi:hypothetical protein
MTIVNTLAIYEKLKEHFKEAGARALTEAIEGALQEYQEYQREFLATKEDIKDMATKADIAALKEYVKDEILGVRQDMAKMEASIREDMTKVEASIREDMTKVEASIREDMTKVEASLRTEIANTRAELIKWMFIFWAGQVGALIGILFLFFK